MSKRSPTPSVRRKAAAIYRKAARLMERGELDDPEQGSCCAISQTLHPRLTRWKAHAKAKDKPILSDYEAMFKPDEQPDHWGYWGKNWPESDRLNCRVLALCFMAAITERP